MLGSSNTQTQLFSFIFIPNDDKYTHGQAANALDTKRGGMKDDRHTEATQQVLQIKPSTRVSKGWTMPKHSWTPWKSLPLQGKM